MPISWKPNFHPIFSTQKSDLKASIYGNHKIFLTTPTILVAFYVKRGVLRIDSSSYPHWY